MLDQKKIDIAKKYKNELIELGIPVKNVFVFGSHVKGTQNKWSDLDVCVVSPIFGVDRLSERVLLTRISRNVSNLIEPHPMDQKDLDDRFNPLSNEIRSYGVKI